MPCPTPRWLALALALVLTLSGGLAALVAPAAAQDPGTATVSVEASVVIPTELSLTLCDSTADFGVGLDYLGTAPTGTGDVIFATAPGDPAQQQGVFYGWTPTCADGGSFFHVESNVPWDSTICATENTGTSSLKVVNTDLRVSIVKATTYAEAVIFGQVRTCDNPATLRGPEQAGTLDATYYLYLQVDRDDTEGTFQSTTTWTVTP